MPVLRINDKEVPYKLVKSSRARCIRITVGPDGVRVSSPKNIDDKLIKDFIRDKQEWIQEKVRKYNLLKDKISKKDLVNGEQLPYIGRSILLTVKETKTGAGIDLKGGSLILAVKKGLSPRERRREIRSKLELWYREQARKTICERLEYYKKRLGVEYNSFRIKEQKTLWGSCSSKKNLNFNWKIIMAPLKIIDYIIVHELCHLIEMKHNERFWKLVKNEMPDYEERRRWLQKNGLMLTL